MPCDVSPVAMFLSNSPALGIVWGCRWPSEGIHTFYSWRGLVFLQKTRQGEQKRADIGQFGLKITEQTKQT